jgi:hypothetical protein
MEVDDTSVKVGVFNCVLKNHSYTTLKYFTTGTFDKSGRKGENVVPDARSGIPVTIRYNADSFKVTRLDVNVVEGKVVDFIAEGIFYFKH